MTPTAQKVCYKLGDFSIEAYQLDGQILFTHRLIGETVVKTKSTAQRYCKLHEGELPTPVTAMVPDKNRPVALSSYRAASAYWHDQASKGNELAIALTKLLETQPLTELQPEVVEPTTTKENIEQVVATLPDGENLPTSKELEEINSTVNIVSVWLSEAGLDKVAIAEWKLNVLAQKFPAAADITNSAQKFLGTSDRQPTSGMIVSQLAEKLSESLGTKVTAAAVNKALHSLGLQEFTKPGSRERKLTEEGKQYGRSILTTSKTNQWSGAQLLWFDSVVPVLVESWEKIQSQSERKIPATN